MGKAALIDGSHPAHVLPLAVWPLQEQIVIFFKFFFALLLPLNARPCLKGFLWELLHLGTLASLSLVLSLNHTIHLSNETVNTQQLSHCKWHSFSLLHRLKYVDRFGLLYFLNEPSSVAHVGTSAFQVINQPTAILIILERSITFYSLNRPMISSSIWDS